MATSFINQGHERLFRLATIVDEQADQQSTKSEIVLEDDIQLFGVYTQSYHLEEECSFGNSFELTLILFKCKNKKIGDEFLRKSAIICNQYLCIEQSNKISLINLE